MEYHFNTDVAIQFGVDEAIFVHSFAFWCAKNKADDRNFYQGRYWSYNTIKALCEWFPFWSKRQIERIVKSCEDKGLLLSIINNKDKTYRAKSYAIGDALIPFYPNGKPVLPETESAGATISPNGEMDFPEQCLPFPQTVECNKDTVIATVIANTCASPVKSLPRHSPDGFASFWKLYCQLGVSSNKSSAVRAWDKLRPDPGLQSTLATVLRAQSQGALWKRGIGIPYAATWLNQRRWEDEVEALGEIMMESEEFMDGI